MLVCLYNIFSVPILYCEYTTKMTMCKRGWFPFVSLHYYGIKNNNKTGYT